MIAAALEMLQERPADEIGLREVARRIGVSSAAPYRHFDSRESLISAAAVHGFGKLERRLQQTIERHGADALAELGQAYVGFALENPNLFGLMLRGDRDGSNDPVRAAGQAAFDLLATTVARLTGAPCREDAVGAWALVHGLSILMAERQLAPDLLEAERLGALVRSVTEIYVAGLSARRRERG